MKQDLKNLRLLMRVIAVIKFGEDLEDSELVGFTRNLRTSYFRLHYSRLPLTKPFKFSPKILKQARFFKDHLHIFKAVIYEYIKV